MTSNNDDNQDDQSQWEAVFSGKRLPLKDSRPEQEADALRQVLIWRKAKQAETHHTPEDAAAFFQHLLDSKRKRKRTKYLYWLKVSIMVAAVLATIGIGFWYVLADNSTPPQTFISSKQNNASDQVPSQFLPLIPELVTIPSGSFMMGCSAGWDDSMGDCQNNEFPAHAVNVSAFHIGRYEVTVGQFKHFVTETGYFTTAEQNDQGCSKADPIKPDSWIVDSTANWLSPGFVQTDSHPVVCISWQDTQQYLKWLNTKTQNQYRLSSETEWEYAARAGKVTAFYWGDSGDRRFANYQGVTAGSKWPFTAPVGQYSSNDFGLHDMSGNVWEWTASCWRESYKTPEVSGESCTDNNVNRAKRGGSWSNNPASIRSAYRSSGPEAERSYSLGFRIAHDY